MVSFWELIKDFLIFFTACRFLKRPSRTEGVRAKVVWCESRHSWLDSGLERMGFQECKLLRPNATYLCNDWKPELMIALSCLSLVWWIKKWARINSLKEESRTLFGVCMCVCVWSERGSYSVLALLHFSSGSFIWGRSEREAFKGWSSVWCPVGPVYS